MLWPRALLGNGWRPEDLILAEVVPERAAQVRAELGCQCVSDPAEAVRGRQTVVVAVKPQDVGTLLEQVSGVITASQLVITLAAGVRIATLENALGDTPGGQGDAQYACSPGKGDSGTGRG